MKEAFFEQFRQLLTDMPSGARLRLAPTPSGFLHRGNAFNFYLNHRLAVSRPEATLLLRIDDLDAERKRPEYIADIFDTLNWLGIGWNEGPLNPADFEEKWSQLHRLPMYVEMLERLKTTGLLFACKKSRRELAPFNGAYPTEFRNQGIDLDDPEAAWRIRTPAGFPLPDFIVKRRDGVPAYQVGCLADDLHFGITHIIRGADLEGSTLAQRFLAKCMGLETIFDQITVLHHPLLLDEEGGKLSKSAGSEAIKSLRQSGRSANELLAGFQAMLAG